MTAFAAPPCPIVRLGPKRPASPIVISVPHAGRHYGEALLRQARLAEAALATLEDRHADALIDDAVAAGAVALVANTARAWIDLNRAPDELDAAMMDLPPGGPAPRESAKLRGGLGIIPRRIALGGDIWRGRLSAAEVAARIAALHAPWHRAIEVALSAARARFGHALLIDCHSMPPLPGERPARLVLGDRFGRSTFGEVTSAMILAGARLGIPVARNAPYAGGYTLDRHARPAEGVHAVQIELCRSLYLDKANDVPGPGLAAGRALVAVLARAGADALAPVGARVATWTRV